MRKVTCKSCGAKVPAPGMYCSASVDIVCQGRAPVPGCGAVLTADERHWYGSACEKCESEWSDRVEAWRRGGKDFELDEMFSVPAPVTH